MLRNALKRGRQTSLLCRDAKVRWSRPAIRWHGGPKVGSGAPTVPISFMNPHPSQADRQTAEKEITVDAKVGESLLQTAHRFSIDLEGACEGVCACSTCHVVFKDKDIYNSLPEPSEDEEDMLGALVRHTTSLI